MLDEHGEPTGLLLENALIAAAGKLPAPTPEEVRASLVEAIAEYNKQGFTTFQDGGLGINGDAAVFLKPPAISILMPLSCLYIQTSYDAAASCKHCRCQKCHNLLFHRLLPPMSDLLDHFLLFYWISSEDARKFLYCANIAPILFLVHRR